MRRQSQATVLEVVRRIQKYRRRLLHWENAAAGDHYGVRKCAFLRKRLAKLLQILWPLRKASYAAALLGLALLDGGKQLAAQTPTITSLAPGTNAIAVARDTDIDITFSTAMASTTLNANTIRIYGSQSGFLSTSGSLSGNPAFSFDPATNFKPGELISVSVTGATSTGGIPLAQPNVHQFRASVSGGLGIFASSGFGGGISRGIALGDLDGDGALDAVVANDSSQVQSVWLNNGDGSFTSSGFGSGLSRDVALGDLDGDGDLDAIIANYYNQPQEIWLNNGDGSFASSGFGAGHSEGVALGDLDGDGDLDAVIANDGQAQEIWLNNGDGSFTSSGFGGGSSEDVALGDLDGDGDLDAVIANYGQAQEVWLNNGSGSFTSSGFGGGFSVSRDVALGDLDGDGDLDAIIANDGNNAQNVWLNNGDGSFTSSDFGGERSRGVSLGDLDGDGDLDAIIANRDDQAQRIWLNNGDGSFTSSAFGGGESLGVALGDIDGDGDLDAVVANGGNQAQEIWLKLTTPLIVNLDPAAGAHNAARNADIDITFDQPMDSATLVAAAAPTNANLIVYGMQTGHITTLASISIADGNRRAIIDPSEDFKPGEKIHVTVTGASNPGGFTLTRATVYGFRAAANGGTAIFASSAFGDPGFASTDVALGDLDGDGDLDAIIANYRDGSYEQPEEIWFNNGDGTFTSTTFGARRSTGVELGDLDGDGDLDAVITNNLGSASEIWLNNGDGVFTSATFGNGGSFGVALGDLDGDGDLDAVIARAFNLPSDIWLNNGDGSFTISQFGANRISQDVALGDIDGDGDLDAIIANYVGTNLKQEVWLNNGDATFISSNGDGRKSRAVELGDLDGDGDLDAVVANRSDQPQSLWLNNGDGTFATSTFGDAWSEDIDFGDVDGDGDLDIVVSNYAFGQTRIWLNNGDATFVSSDLFFGKNKATALGDLDGDGDLDMVTAIDDAQQRIWLNQPPPPIITNVQPVCVLEDSGPLQLTIDGAFFESTTAQISVLNAQGTPAGTIGLPILASSATQLVAQIPDVSLTTAGILAITVANQVGSTGTTLTVNALVSVAGNSCGCPGVAYTYTAEPLVTNAAHVWSVTGGTIIGGQGTGSVQVVWDVGAAVSLGVVRTYPSGCTSASALNVAPKNIAKTVFDNATVATNASVTLAVLSNDIGSGLTLVSVDDPAGGLASHTNGNVIYTPDSGFAGIDRFGYTLEDNQGCRVTGAIVITVAGATQSVSLTFNDIVVDGAGSVQGLHGPVAAALSGDGRYVYAAGQLSSSIAVFERNGADGNLTFKSVARQGVDGIAGLALPTDVALSPDGAFLYATDAGSNALAVFSRNGATGALTFVETKINGDVNGGGTIVGLQRPAALAVSPDGEHVYAAGYDANSVVVFARNQITGILTFVERITNNVGGVTGLTRPTSIALSPDGIHLYASGRKDNSVAVFSRDIATGALTFVESRTDGIGGADGLRGAACATVSPDGLHVYVVGAQDKAVAVFRRDVSTGALTFLERHKDGRNGVNGLDGAAHVTVSPNGTTVYVAGEQAGAVCIFRRNPATGALTFLERRVDERGGVQGLARIRDIVISPDSRHIYCVGMFDNAIATFNANGAK